MRIVRIDDLSEEERKKALERQEQRYQENEIARKNEINRVNRAFDENSEVLPVAKNGYIDSKRKENNIWSDLKGIASNFTRSLGNLSINAYENVNRINGEYINNRNKLIKDTNNRYLMKSLKDKGYSDEQIQRMTKNAPTLESIANNSKVLKNITNNTNKVIQPMENKFQEWENINNEKIQENIDNASNSISKKILEITPSIAQSSVNLIPGGNVLFSAGITQNYYEQAKKEKGMSDDEASKYASIMATLESATEMIGAKLTKNVGKSLIKGNIKSAFANYGLDIGENFLEEAIMEPLGEVTAQITAGKEKADWKDIWQRSLKAGIDGALTSALMGGASAVVGKSANLINKANNSNTYKDYNSNEILDKHTQNILNKAEDIIKKNNIDNLLQNQVNNIHNMQTQQITQEQNKMSQNQTSTELNDMLNNKELPMQSYQYEKSNNVKINNLRQDANRYFNNSEKARNYVSMLEKIITDKDIEIRLDGNLKTTDGKIANGSYSNGVITINPNSTTVGEFIAVHELTHAIGTKEMLNMVNTYRKSNIEFDTDMKSLLQNYNETEISEEALSDVAGQLFGNQEFINNIAQENPNIFQKLYNEIKYLWHQFRGYKNQNQFVEDLYYKWTQAYNSNNKLNETSSFSIQKDSNGNKYVKVDTDQDIFEGIAEKDYNKIAKMYMQDYLMGETTLSNTDKAIIDRKSANKYTNPGKTQYKFIEKMKLTPELKNALEISEKISQKSPVKSNSKYSNWEYYKFNFSINGNNFEGLINIGIDNDGNKHFYEINNIKKTSISGTSLNNRTSLSNNSIAPTKNDVNTNTKYSIQESENNSGSFSMQDKRFDVTGNENLNNASTLFFRTREDGVYYVQATNNAGEITYDGTFIDKHMLEKSLGADIAEYIVNNSETTNNEIYLESSKVENKTDYMMRHRPSEEYGNGSNFESNMDGVFENPEWYMNMREDYNIESLNALRKVRKKPNAEIIIYRATPGNEINFGDWVTPSKKYAELHNNSQLNGKGNILKLKVKAKDILWGGDDINEFGYFPDNNKYSQNNQTWQQYLDKNFKPTGTRTNMQEILPTAQNEGSFSNIQAQQKNKVLNNITNIEEPKSMELPSNEKTSKENKIAKVLTTPIKKQKTSQRLWAIVQANFIDKGAVFETLSLKTKVNGKYNRELQSKWDATLSSSAKGQYAIGNDRYVFKNGKKTLQSKSLSNIIEEVGDNPSDFYNYMYHQLNIDRMTLEERFGGDTGINYERKEIVKNKPVFGEDVTADISRQIVAEYEEKFPKFKSYAQDVYDFLDANKQELVNSGVISQELSDKFKEMYPHYVPIARVNKNNNAIHVPLDTNRTGINNPIKRAKGGSNDIQPLFHTMADRTLQTYRASARNAFGVELKNTLEINNLLNYTNENTDVDTIIDTMEDEQQTGLTEGTKYKNPTFTVFENGKKVTFDINQDMYDALKPQSEFITKINNTKASKFVNEVSNIRRGMLTEYNPLFAITNAIKDVGDVFIHSQHALKTYSKMPEAIMQIIKKGYWNGEYLQNGGKQNSYFKDGEFEQFERKNILQKSKNVITLPLRMISAVNNVIEMTPRLAEYIASRQMGESIETSMLDASRVTTNFKAGGDITKLANRNGFTFLNAGVQGASQVVRNLREANAKGLKGYAVLATKFTIAGVVPVLLNNLFWGDDDDYEELQDYVKDNYYIIGKIGEHEFIRIPKARVASVIQKLFSTANKYITKGKEINIDNFAEDFWANLMFSMDNIAPNNPIENNIASPLIQVAKNETWYGDDLVPGRLQNVPKTEQYDETTDKFSIWLGQTLGLSPMKINYLLDQYGGGVSDVLLPLGTPQAENNVFTDKFTTNSVIKSKYPGEFFEKSDKLKINSNSMNATDEDNLKYKYISSISKETSDLYKKKREIQSSALSDEEKKKQILEIQKQINSLSKEAIEKVEKTNINGNTAIIGGKKYYKTTDIKDATKTWKELTEEEIEKNKNISLTTYTNYKEQVAQETIKQRKNRTIKEDGSIKSKDKISILINSKYSNVEKQALYENYILSDADKKYAIVKDLFKNKPDGLNINNYLKYKLADSNEEFKADRKDDGTEDGKSITGSGNIKRFDYIDSIEGASYTQKLILYALDCKPSTRYQKDLVVNYITTNYKGNRQKEVLKVFGAEIYKDGTFDW